MFEEGAWFGHNLASLNRVPPESTAEFFVGMITKALALKAYGVRYFSVTQWTHGLYIHTKFGPLDLVTHIHRLIEPYDSTYAFDVHDDGLRVPLEIPLIGSITPRLLYLDGDDEEAVRALQADIEAGAKPQLVGAPSVQEMRPLSDPHHLRSQLPRFFAYVLDDSQHD